MFQTDDDMKIYEGEPAPPERTWRMYRVKAVESVIMAKISGLSSSTLLRNVADEDLIREGNALAKEYRALFSGIIQSYTFQ